MSGDKSKVATGQIGDDPYVCVWHPHTMETLSVLKDGHMNGIRRVQFNSDGKVRGHSEVAKRSRWGYDKAIRLRQILCRWTVQSIPSLPKYV